MGKALYEAAPAPKAFIELAGDHNNGFLLSRDHYREGLAKFIADHLEDGTD
jgi:hypothetical protein